ncbi:MAG: family 10 glycosylhydrolase, partial [Ruminococcus sp.]|nr:family 10 glycosylhydrolase [Ruminococcus sp.]
ILKDDSTRDLSEWRRDNCSLLVREIYTAVKSVDENIVFGVSPQGNIENNYNQMYADVYQWCSEDGYLDYICPQIYFGYYNSVCPFTETLLRWEDIVTADNVKLVCGLGLYQAEHDSEFINDTGIIARQIEDASAEVKCSGFAIYSYDSLFCKDTQRFNDEREAISTIIN